MKKYGASILNSLIILMGVCGLYFTLFGSGEFMNNDSFLYYTVQSNLLAILTAAIVLGFSLRSLRGRAIPAAVQFLRLLSTVAITLTFLVFSLMLTPEMIRSGNGAYLTTPGNLFVHNLVPLGAMLDWCLYGSARGLGRRSAFCGLIPAVAYTAFVYVRAFSGLDFSGNLVPYFFFDYQRFGWLRLDRGGLGVVYWLLILIAVLIGMGFGFLAIARRREARQTQRQGC